MIKIFLVILLLTACGNPDKPPALRTSGWMSVGETWVESDRRVRGDSIWIEYRRGNESRWFVTKDLMTHPVPTDTEIPE